MKNMLREIIWGKNRFNGVFAVVVVGLVLAGCCGLGSDTGSKLTNTTTSNTGDSPFGKDNPFSKNTGTTDSDDSDTSDTNYTKADASKEQIPVEAELQEMAKTTILDFSDALEKGDFSDFYSTIAKTWQKQIKPENLNTSFQQFIDKKVSFSDVKNKKANFTGAARIDKSRGMKELVFSGRYASSPYPCTFELNYIPEGKEWKLYGIKVAPR